MMTSSVAGPWISFQSISQSQLIPKKDHGHCCCMLPVWSTIAFWIPVKPRHLRSTLSEEMRCTENDNAAAALVNKTAQFFSMTMPGCRKTNASEVNELGYKVLSHLPRSPDLTPTATSSSTSFSRENASPTSRRQKMLSKSLLNPEAQIFMLQEKKNLFLVGKNKLIVMAPVLINKDVFESS